MGERKSGGNGLPISHIYGSGDEPAGRNWGLVIPSVEFSVIAKRQSVAYSAAGVNPASDTLWPRYFSGSGSPVEQFSVIREGQLVATAGRNFEPGVYARGFRNQDRSDLMIRIPLIEISVVSDCGQAVARDCPPTPHASRTRDENWNENRGKGCAYSQVPIFIIPTGVEFSGCGNDERRGAKLRRQLRNSRCRCRDGE